MQFFPQKETSTANNIFSGSFINDLTPNQLSKQKPKLQATFENNLKQAIKDDTAPSNKAIPFNETNFPGVAKGFRSYKDNKSFMDSDKLNALENALHNQYGLSEEHAARFLTGLQKENSELTIGKILNAATRPKGEGIALENEDISTLEDFLTRLGFNNEEKSQLLFFVADGQNEKLLYAIQNKLGQFEQNLLQENAPQTTANGLISMSSKDASAFVKALNLPQDISNQILKQFNDQNELEFNSKGFNKLFDTAHAKFEQISAANELIKKAAPEIIKNILEQAKLDKVTAINTDNRGSKRDENLEALMNDKASLAGKSILSKAQETTKNVAEGQLINPKNVEADLPGEKLMSLAEEKAAKAPFKPVTHDLAEDKNSKQQQNDTQTGQQVNVGKTILATKIDVVQGVNFSGQVQMPDSHQSPQAAKAFMYQEKLFAQVSNGILQNAMNGSKQITLRLDPPELGSLVLNLKIANGAIRAVIRTESTETTAALSEQLAQLKGKLEEQGFKVTKLEIETKTQSEQNLQHWDTAEQHNKEQELFEMADFIRLSKSRAKDAEELAQKMQINTHKETISDQGLHIVA